MSGKLENILYRTYALAPWLNERVRFLLAAPRLARWLDIGSGTGHVANNLHALRPDLHLTATDLEDFSGHYAGEANTEFVRLSGARWPFADESFDVLTSFHVIEHVPESERQTFFAEVTRVLAPGGAFYLETPSARSLLLPEIKSRHGITNFWQDATHVSLVTPEQFRAGADACGWRDVRIGIYRNRLFVLAAPLLLPFAFFPPGNLAYHYSMPHLIGWSIRCTGTK